MLYHWKKWRQYCLYEDLAMTEWTFRILNHYSFTSKWACHKCFRQNLITLWSPEPGLNLYTLDFSSYTELIKHKTFMNAEINKQGKKKKVQGSVYNIRKLLTLARLSTETGSSLHKTKLTSLVLCQSHWPSFHGCQKLLFIFTVWKET